MVATSLYMSQEKHIRKKGLEVRFLEQLPAAIQIGEGHPLYHATKVTQKEFADDHFLDVPGRSVSYALLKSSIMRVR